MSTGNKRSGLCPSGEGQGTSLRGGLVSCLVVGGMGAGRWGAGQTFCALQLCTSCPQTAGLGGWAWGPEIRRQPLKPAGVRRGRGSHWHGSLGSPAGQGGLCADAAADQEALGL